MQSSKMYTKTMPRYITSAKMILRHSSCDPLSMHLRENVRREIAYD